MPWITYSGVSIDYPYKLHADIVKKTNLNKDDVLDLLDKAKKIHSIAMSMDATIRELRHENLMLKHQNEFMLTLINDRLNDV